MPQLAPPHAFPEPTKAELADLLPSAEAPSDAEAVRAADDVSRLVGDFHDRHWLARGETGDVAAASAATIAAISSDARQRSTAAHLYAVRTSQRLVSHVMHVVANRAPRNATQLKGEEFAAELESAVGAAMHAELCRIFDEVSHVHGLIREQYEELQPPSPRLVQPPNTP